MLIKATLHGCIGHCRPTHDNLLIRLALTFVTADPLLYLLPVMAQVSSNF